jgi:UDPglucose 6-dehydrogenase
LLKLNQARGSDTPLVSAWIADSQRQRDWPLRVIEPIVRGLVDPCIAILGLAYKEHTNSIKNSAALHLIRRLGSCRLQVYDPVVGVEAVAPLHDRITAAESALDACKGADIVCVMTPWPQFRALNSGHVANAMRGNVIVDPYRLLPRQETIRHRLEHHILGAASH